MQLTPFGLEAYRHFVIPFEKTPSMRKAPKKGKAKRKTPRT
jgi:hypothetical protein